MSYKNRKWKKNIINQLIYRAGLVKAVLFNFWSKMRMRFARKESMRLPQTQRIMEALRILNRGAAQNNKKIDEWVDAYVNERILAGRQVEILLQWCTGLGLVKRMENQDGRFIPLPAEIDLVQKQIPRVIEAFEQRDVRVSWIITFNRSYIERRRLSDDAFSAYMDMVKWLARGIPELDRNVLLLDWDEFSGKIQPNQKILEKFDVFVSKNALEYEMRTFLQMLKEYPDAPTSQDELRAEAERRIAYESEEARFLAGPESPFDDGRFLLVPLEKPERYVFFDLLIPEFTKRIASVVKLYPWRLNS